MTAAAQPSRAAAPEIRFQPMTPVQLPAVLAVEQASHSHPWTHGNFLDSLHTGWYAQCLIAGDQLVGYCVAMPGVDEAHLLNLTVAPAYRGQGWARVLLDALALWARGQNAHWIWLEVRGSNLRALHIYEHNGFVRTGLRKDYYRSRYDGAREDAVLMSRPL
jgi:ribosomal-protein-alanine N-acetyltransferase